MFHKKFRCVPSCPFSITVVTLRSLRITLPPHFSPLGFRDTGLIMPVKQFNSTLCQRNTDGCLISFNSDFSGKLSFNMNTWMEPRREARARVFTVNDVKLKVGDREENLRRRTHCRFQIMVILAYTILSVVES